MATPPARNEISDTYPNPSITVARVGFGKLYDYVTGLLGTTGNPTEALVAIGERTGATGTKTMPSGTTAQRSNTVGIRYNSDLSTWESYNGTSWISIANGAANTTITSIDSVLVGRGPGTSTYNTRYGNGAFNSNTTGTNSTAVGFNALSLNTTGNFNTALGSYALYNSGTGNSNLAIGYNALYTNISGFENVAIGPNALYYSTGYYNVAIGSLALYNNTNGYSNIAIGYKSLNSNLGGNDNLAIGSQALEKNTTGYSNIAIGYNSLSKNINGGNNQAMGVAALRDNLSGNLNVAIGDGASILNTSGSNNTALGKNALQINTTFSNATGLGASSAVTASNQVQLGDSATTTYAYGAVQNRSDIRDKADIRDTVLGLEFIKALRPVDFKWDMRESYRSTIPTSPGPDASLAEKSVYKIALDAWIVSSKLSNIIPDGTHKRNRYHHGLVAQEVQAVMNATSSDFGGLQNHAIVGGDDVLSIGYEELIAPMIKAIQQQQLIIDSLQVRLVAAGL